MHAIKIIQTVGEETDKAQLEFNRQCETTEYLYSGTLAKRLENCKTEVEKREVICDWFQSLRTMTVANFLSTGLASTFKVERS